MSNTIVQKVQRTKLDSESFVNVHQFIRDLYVMLKKSCSIKDLIYPFCLSKCFGRNNILFYIIIFTIRLSSTFKLNILRYVNYFGTTRMLTESWSMEELKVSIGKSMEKDPPWFTNETRDLINKKKSYLDSALIMKKLYSDYESGKVKNMETSGIFSESFLFRLFWANTRKASKKKESGNNSDVSEFSICFFQDFLINCSRFKFQFR